MSRQATAEAFGLFAAAYPSHKRSDELTMAVWAQSLERFPSHQIVLGARRWIEREHRYPSLAAFSECISALTSPYAVTKELERGECPECQDTGWSEVPGERNMVAVCRFRCVPKPNLYDMAPLVPEVRKRGNGGVVEARVVLARIRPAARARR